VTQLERYLAEHFAEVRQKMQAEADKSGRRVVVSHENLVSGESSKEVLVPDPERIMRKCF
jgi:hypothetical protein